MQVIFHPERRTWASILKRPYADNSHVLNAVHEIINSVKEKGDAALMEFSKRFDGIAPDALLVTDAEFEAAEQMVAETLKKAIHVARKNIEAFHKAQVIPSKVVETMQGIACWQKSVAIGKVGLYIPGGTAPLFSTVLMLAIPAQLAGCKEIILCTPPDKNGNINPAILFTARLYGITKVYKVGGAQAIAAMAFGTETIPAVYKIFGPGNQYVTAAKQEVQQHGIAIDMPAGPSEVCVLADDSAVPEFVAADLLSQAEHGRDSQVLLVSTSDDLVKKVVNEITKQVTQLPRNEIAKQALQNSKMLVAASMDEAIGIVNEYAAEHLILACTDAEAIAEKITAAGSVFIGNWAPESAGDYASGTNHTLPTNGYARAYSGVSLDSFMKKVTFQKLTKQGLQHIAETVVTMAEAESLHAHAEAVRIRLAQA